MDKHTADIVIALLNWPFLLTVLLTVLLVRFRAQVGESARV